MHILYGNVLSRGSNFNTLQMSKPDMGSIFHIKNQWNILVIWNYYVNYQNLMLSTSSDTKQILMHLFLFTNSEQRELISIWTQSLRNCNKLSLHYNLDFTHQDIQIQGKLLKFWNEIEFEEMYIKCSGMKRNVFLNILLMFITWFESKSCLPMLKFFQLTVILRKFTLLGAHHKLGWNSWFIFYTACSLGLIDR